MTTNLTTPVAVAIDDSIMEDRIVHLDYDADDVGAIIDALRSACDDSVETSTQYGATMIEFWGRRDGQPWRVHVVTSPDSGD